MQANAWLGVLFAVVIAGCFPLVITCWRWKSTAGASSLGVAGLGMVVWSIGSLVQVTSHLDVLGTAISFLGIGMLPPSWLTFALRSNGRRVPLPFVVVSVIMAVAGPIAVLTNVRHHLLWGPPAHVGDNFGAGPQVFYWCFVAYAYCLMLAGTGILLVSSFSQPAFFRHRSLMMAAAGAIPILISVLNEASILPVAPVDPTPLGFPVSLGLATWALLRLRFLDVVAVPTHVLIGQLQEGMIVIDTADRVLFMNPAAGKVLSVDDEKSVGKKAVELAPEWEQFRSACDGNGGRGMVNLCRGNDSLILEVRATTLRADDGDVTGHMILFENVTERHRRDQERERLITDLQTAQAQVKTLSGLLPICSACKKIKDEHGEWHRVESYIRARTEATFTHGLCPECRRDLEATIPR